LQNHLSSSQVVSTRFGFMSLGSLHCSNNCATIECHITVESSFPDVEISSDAWHLDGAAAATQRVESLYDVSRVEICGESTAVGGHDRCSDVKHDVIGDVIDQSFSRSPLPVSTAANDLM